MDRLYFETNSLQQEIHAGFASLERAKNRDQAFVIEQQLEQQIGKILANCEQLDGLAARETAARRRVAKQRVEQLRFDCRHLQAAFEAMRARVAGRVRSAAERDELLSRRFAANDATAVQMGDGDGQQHERLSSANRRVDELLDSGRAVIDNLRSQHMNLKGARRKMLDVAQGLGMSNTVMRLIEKRTTQDKIFLFGGMVVTSIIMFVLYRWLRG